jgi:ATPase components of ABC transporters with duplicated ATPase domains
MQSRVKNFEKRIDREIEEKEGLLKDIEKVDDLKLMPLEHHKKCLVDCRDFSLGYYLNDDLQDKSQEEAVKKSPEEKQKIILGDITFQLMQGEILFLSGENGCGKSSLIKAIMKEAKHSDSTEEADNMYTSGRLEVASGLVISYVSQDTSGLSGSLRDYAEKRGLDYSLFLTLLRKLDMNRIQFEKNIEEYSEGQKKKVLIAASLLTRAHLYIWDEPLNYIDIFSRMQIEKLIETYKPTMIMVEHDERFREKLATKVIKL